MFQDSGFHNQNRYPSVFFESPYRDREKLRQQFHPLSFQTVPEEFRGLSLAQDQSSLLLQDSRIRLQLQQNPKVFHLHQI